MSTFDLYKSNGKSRLPDFDINEKLNDPALYTPSGALVDAVNVALALGQPLLITGEPGTGKTQLAYHVAHFFGLGQPLVFTVQTSSVASELFYKYDALGHFQYNQNNAAQLDAQGIERQFISFNALGQAIRARERKVVLIDEVDKAPRDLPNDVLFAIESLSFRVPEINRVFEADHKHRPIIILTSNSEKNLPDAFMRRVVYYHIPFPSASELLYILSRKTEQISQLDLDKLIKHFIKIRDLKLKKPPSTAELIYWVLLLQKVDFPIKKINEALSWEERNQLLMTYSVLAKNKEDLEMLRKM
ncbi:MAG: MoxR family ATPase [Saprospiraceae bacterium]|nr:MoxR family ATPase [Saprospiraceae bacterium]